jgi:hypothetical protein
MAPLANHSFACESCARTACSTHRVAFLIDHRTIFRHSVLEITGRSIAPNSIISLFISLLQNQAFGCWIGQSADLFPGFEKILPRSYGQLARKLSHPVLGRSQRSSGGSLLGANIAPDFRRRASLRWLTCNRTAPRPRRDRGPAFLHRVPSLGGIASQITCHGIDTV